MAVLCSEQNRRNRQDANQDTATPAEAFLPPAQVASGAVAIRNGVVAFRSVGSEAGC
jgi:hypothetical protein